MTTGGRREKGARDGQTDWCCGLATTLSYSKFNSEFAEEEDDLTLLSEFKLCAARMLEVSSTLLLCAWKAASVPEMAAGYTN